MKFIYENIRKSEAAGEGRKSGRKRWHVCCFGESRSERRKGKWIVRETVRKSNSSFFLKPSSLRYFDLMLNLSGINFA